MPTPPTIASVVGSIPVEEEKKTKKKEEEEEEEEKAQILA
jgi:hypothetical protein